MCFPGPAATAHSALLLRGWQPQKGAVPRPGGQPVEVRAAIHLPSTLPRWPDSSCHCPLPGEWAGLPQASPYKPLSYCVTELEEAATHVY